MQLRRPLRRNNRWVWVLILLAAMGGAPVLNAAPVLTYLQPETDEGDSAFTEVLAAAWQGTNFPTAHRLRLRRMAGGDPSRLRTLTRGRGHFTAVDAASATRLLAGHPHLTAVAVLWPRLLHALSRNPDLSAVELPFNAELWVFDATGAAFTALHTLEPESEPLAQAALASARDNPLPLGLESTDSAMQGQAIIGPVSMPGDLLSEALDYAVEPLLLVSAPSPSAQIDEILGRDPMLRLLPFNPRLLEELKLSAPWVLTARLSAGSNPRTNANLEVPAVYQILVGRRDLEEPAVRKMLHLLYRKKAATAPHHPLFGQIDGKLNAYFGKLVPFHAVTERVFGFTSSRP